jgi:hypothetical protein
MGCCMNVNFSRRKEVVAFTLAETVKSLLQLIHHESKCCVLVQIQGYFALACGKCFVLYIKKGKTLLTHPDFIILLFVVLLFPLTVK